MDSLISRQAAIDALCSKCTVDKPETCSTIQKGDNWCEEVHILQNVPSAQPEPQWIPVSERVPENGKYIVTVHGYGWNGTMFTSVSIAECISKRWVGNNGVIAWMPLPEPYQKGAANA